MITVYVNGNRIFKDKLSKIEIHSERIKKIMSEKLTKSK